MKKESKPAEVAMRPLHPDAVGQEVREITRQLNETELAEKNSKHTDLAMQQDDADDEFKLISDAHKAESKARKTEMKEIRTIIKKERVITSVLCDKVPDYEKNMMQFIDEHGVVVDERRLRPDERQKDLVVEATTVTDRSGTHG